MTAQETNRILAMMVEVYPKFNEGRNPQLTSKLWNAIFQDEPYEWVEKALLAFIATDAKGFPPTPGAIKEKIQQLIGSEELTEMEAWNLVVKAASNSGWHSKEEFEKLPAEVQEIVGSPSTLREWAMMDADEFHSVIGSNFQRSYRARTESRKMFGRLPESLKISLPKKETTSLPQPESVPLPEPEYVPMPESFREIAQRVLHITD